MALQFPYTDLVFSITETIDLISPLLANHHKLVAYISYSIGKQLELNTYEQLELEIAGSLHDIGGLSLKERIAPIEFDYEDLNLNFHSEKGYLILNKFKPFSNVAKIIRYHHKEWLNGKCLGFNGEDIPIGSHILNLADRVSILLNQKDDNILNHVDDIVSKIKLYEGNVFHPKIVEAFLKLSKKDYFWLDMNYLGNPNYMNEKYESNFLNITENEFEDFMKVVSHIVDFKSRFTAAHSITIAACAQIIAKLTGFNEEETKMIKYAGYIHDLGKLAIPNEILEKSGSLTKEEFSLMRAHTYHTNRVLEKVRGFDTIRLWGSLHHEKLNGKGYPFGLKAYEIPMGARIMAVADIFTALRERRPYRDPMTKESTLNVLLNMANSYQIDMEVVKVLQNNLEEIDLVREIANKNAFYQYESFNNEFLKNKSIMLSF